MKIFFINSGLSNLADDTSNVLLKVREVLLSFQPFEEVFNPEEADALIIQEKYSFKNFRYITDLLNDPLINKNLSKIYTINSDDCATGLLRGLYTCLPKDRYDPTFHIAVPYMEYPNELVFIGQENKTDPHYLASWRGNPKSSVVRRKILQYYQSHKDFCLQNTDSWLNHSVDEKKVYIDVILNSKFSLCPQGWAPVSFRIYESMALSRSPVIIADNFVPPQGPSWSDFALFFPQRKLEDLCTFLIRNEPRHQELGQLALDNWHKYFSPNNINKYYAIALKSLLLSSSKYTRESELRRWSSLNLFWSNKWTFPQRIVNKIRNLAIGN